MRLLIAEKPSVAKAIRKVLPPGSDITVTFCYGHMLELAEPSTYDARWANWNIADLPIRVEQWKLVPKATTSQQLAVIQGLMRGATEIIHAGDPDREGQLLVDEILEYFGWTGPVWRIFITATKATTVTKALAKMEDNAKYKGLRHAAECRQRADWLVGMNLTRAVTKMLSPGTTISIGRVQTPTLALAVRRHLIINGFASHKFWTFRGRFLLSGARVIELRCEPDPRITDEKLAAGIAKAMKLTKAPLTVKVETKHRLSPFPYDLGDFQTAAERYYGWTIAKSLAALQAAYEAELTSYPRVECKYLQEDQMADALVIAAQVGAALKIPAEHLGRMQPKARVYDSSKVNLHHGIVPTGSIPTADVSQEARMAWHLVSLHFLQTLMPDEAYEQTEISTTIATSADSPLDKLRFSRKAERPLNPTEHWKRLDLETLLPVAPKRKKKSAADIAGPIPHIANGEIADITECRCHEGKTTPPEPYTESTLKDDMAAVSKYVEDPRLKAVLKDTAGIGTPATRANIIETLKGRGYLQSGAGNTIEPTALGIDIIKCIPPELADPGITAAWEDAFHQIAENAYEPAHFMQRVDQMVVKRIAQTTALQTAGTRITAPGPPRASGKPAAKKAARTKLFKKR